MQREQWANLVHGVGLAAIFVIARTFLRITRVKGLGIEDCCISFAYLLLEPNNQGMPRVPYKESKMWQERAEMPQLSNTPQGLHYITEKPDSISRGSVSRIKDLDIPKASGLTYHGSRVSFDSLHRATTSKITIALSAVVTPYQAVRETVGEFSILMEAHLRAITAEKGRI